MRSFTLLGVGCLLVAACGQQASSSEVTLDSTVVKSESSALATAVSAAESDDGADVAAEVGSLGSSIAAMIPRTANGARGRSKSPVATSGSVSWSDGKIACNELTFDVSSLGATVIDGETLKIGASHVAVTCSFAYGQGTLAGSLHATGDASVNDVAYSWDATLTAKGLTYSSRAAFTGGSVSVDATVTTSSQTDGSETFHATGAVSFP